MTGSDRNRFGRALLTTGLANLANPLSAILIAPVLAQVLGVDGRGAVAAVAAPITLATTAALLGLPEAATYAVARHRNASTKILKHATWMLVISGAIATAAVVLAAPVIVKEDPELIRLTLAASATIVPALLVGALRGQAAGLQAWTLINGEKYAGAGLRLIAIPVLAYTDSLTPITAVAVIVGSPVVAGAIYLALPKYASADDSELDGDMPVRWQSFAQYGGRVWIGTLSGVLLSRLDQVLMSPLSSTTQLGLYVIAANIADVALVINNGVRDVVFATESKSQRQSRALLAARLSAAVSLFGAVALAATMPFWIGVVFGESFVPAIAPAVILLAAGVLGVPGSIAGAMLNAAGHPGLRSLAVAIAVVINVGILVLTVPAYGAVGAAVAMLVGNLVAANVNIWFICRRMNVQIRDFYLIRPSDLGAALRTFRSTTLQR